MRDTNGGKITDVQWKVLCDVHERLDKMDMEGSTILDPLIKEQKSFNNDIVMIMERIIKMKKEK